MSKGMNVVIAFVFFYINIERIALIYYAYMNKK